MICIVLLSVVVVVAIADEFVFEWTLLGLLNMYHCLIVVICTINNVAARQLDITINTVSAVVGLFVPVSCLAGHDIN